MTGKATPPRPCPQQIHCRNCANATLIVRACQRGDCPCAPHHQIARPAGRRTR